MKIALGSIQCEGNSLTPIATRLEDFDYASGEAMYSKIKVSEYFRKEGFDIVPTIYAHALPGGAVVKEDFLRLAHELADAIPSDVDGVWLYIHGAMYVEEIGSGDTYLLDIVRRKVGDSVPISVAMDFHANNTDKIVELANCITAFRTAPHTDHSRAQMRAASMLVTCLREGILPRPCIERANVVVCGDAVQTALEPLRSIMARAEEMEREDKDLLCAQVFNGQSWVDVPYMGPSFVITHKSNRSLAKDYACELARMFYEARHDFRFLIEALEPEEALKRAAHAKEQVFVSDSGDNTTAGAAGDNAYMLRLVQQMGMDNVLVAGIADAPACMECYKHFLGDTLTLTVGGTLAPDSQSTTVTGRLIHKGDILSYTGANAGESATLDCGKYTLVITKNRAALCRPDIFESIDLDFAPYKTVIVKLGYLFPELSEVAERSILAFTPGSSTERLEDMNMKNIRRPMFPLDDDFM